MKMKMLFDGWKIELLAFTGSHNALAVWHGCHFFASSQRNGEDMVGFSNKDTSKV
jgi:hypothetical protein